MPHKSGKPAYAPQPGHPGKEKMPVKPKHGAPMVMPAVKPGKRDLAHR